MKLIGQIHIQIVTLIYHCRSNETNFDVYSKDIENYYDSILSCFVKSSEFLINLNGNRDSGSVWGCSWLVEHAAKHHARARSCYTGVMLGPRDMVRSMRLCIIVESDLNMPYDIVEIIMNRLKFIRLLVIFRRKIVQNSWRK